MRRLLLVGSFGLGTIAFAFAMSTACGGESANTDASEGGTPSSSTSSPSPYPSYPSPSGSSGSETPASCPATPPSAGGACDGPVECEYGGDEYGNCPNEVRCGKAHFGSSYTWIVDGVRKGCTSLPAWCPATKSAVVEGSACTPPGDDVYDSCAYPEAACACVMCRAANGGVAGRWRCREWTDVKYPCPTKPRAHLGMPCAAPGLRCDYNRCWNQWHSDVSLSGPIADLQCRAGIWQFDLSGTPASQIPNPCPQELPACP